jgi:predicted pyridoxine 5'-phosphate oxidase superfamily flavin-nucleotide-binding protein
MTHEFLRTVLTPSVREAQRSAYGREYPHYGTTRGADLLGPAELEFIAARDSFYMATVTEDGWPYVQHRGGPEGFLVARSPSELVFADYTGNRQLVTAGNVAHERRVCLFLMDYAGRTRLKLLGLASVHDARERPDLVVAATPPAGHPAQAERCFVIEVASYDWNCPKYITPRHTEADVTRVIAGLQARVRELEALLPSA